MCVHKSHKNIYVQLIDDLKEHTLLSVSTNDKDIKAKLKNRANRSAAEILGAHVAAKAKEKKISKVVFDRAGYQYHGVVKALVESARKSGLLF